jgi:hypothetical protein
VDDVVEHLRHCAVLHEFSDVGLQIIAAVVKKKIYQNAQTLQVQGEKPKGTRVSSSSRPARSAARWLIRSRRCWASAR